MARILVVDDDADVRRAIRRILEPEGHEVVQAENGRAAMAVMEAESADLVVTDLYMEPMDGVELVIRLRQVDDAVPIIAISGGGWEPADKVLERIRGLGVDTTVQKPFDSDELRELIREKLRGAHPG